MGSEIDEQEGGQGEINLDSLEESVFDFPGIEVFMHTAKMISEKFMRAKSQNGPIVDFIEKCYLNVDSDGQTIYKCFCGLTFEKKQRYAGHMKKHSLRTKQGKEKRQRKKEMKTKKKQKRVKKMGNRDRDGLGPKSY